MTTLAENTLKRDMVGQKPRIGLWCTLASPTVAELLGGSGFDFLVLDCEHSPNDLNSILLQLQALAGTPTQAVVRPPINDPVMFKRLLDIGVRNLLVPMVQSADEARAAVASCAAYNDNLGDNDMRMMLVALVALSGVSHAALAADNTKPSAATEAANAALAVLFGAGTATLTPASKMNVSNRG